MAHTPGPWVVGPHSESVDANGQELVCVYQTDGADEPTDLPFVANAHLIAAAPELLDELKHLVRILKPVLDAGLPVPGLATMNRAVALIAKAEGRS